MAGLIVVLSFLASVVTPGENLHIYCTVVLVGDCLDLLLLLARLTMSDVNEIMMAKHVKTNTRKTSGGR